MSDVATGGLWFEDRASFAGWLEGRPREEAVILAARAALRVLPIAAREMERKTARADARPFLALSAALFRATALARVAAKYPTRANDLRAAANAAAFAADAAFAANAAAAANDLRAAAWRALSIDASFLAAGGNVAALADRALWPQGTPAWASDYWTKLSLALPASEDWDVWTRWYGERLTGAPDRGEIYELVFATVPQEKWNEGPAAANAWIKAHLPPPAETPSLEKLPEQIAAAARFIESGAGPIDIARDPAASAAALREEQREHYDEARRKALELSALGRNFLGEELRGAVASLLERFPQSMDDVSIVALWHRANSLRKTLQAQQAAADRYHKAVERGAKPDPDPAMLDSAVIGKLDDFVESYNLFIVGDDKGRELDRKRLGPGERERDEKALAEIAPALADLENQPEVATADAAEILEELRDAAQKAPEGLAGDQDVALGRDSVGNFFIALWRKARRLLDSPEKIVAGGLLAGAAKFEGEKLAEAANHTLGGPILHYIAQWADAMKLFAIAVYHNPSIPQLIDAIARHLLRGTP